MSREKRYIEDLRSTYKEFLMNKLSLSLGFIIAGMLTSTMVVSADEKDAKLVTVQTVKNEQVNPTTWLPGNVISRTNAPISAEQIGLLLWVEDIGAKVEKGQVIASIDNRHLKLQLTQRRC